MGGLIVQLGKGPPPEEEGDKLPEGADLMKSLFQALRKGDFEEAWSVFQASKDCCEMSEDEE